MTEPKVSIVVVNYNGKKLLEFLLRSISRLKYKNYEILVVDNNSSDGSQEFIKKNYKKVKLISNKKNLGYSGINSAVKYCKGEYILFLNNDMELDKNCIRELIKSIKSDKNIAMAAPKLVNFYDKKIKSGGTWVSRAFYSGHMAGNKEKTKEIPYLGVGLIKKDFVNMYGYLFDSDYFIYAEDLDLGLRIRLNSKKAIFEPKAILYHMHSVTMQKSDKSFSTYLMERNMLTTFFKILSIKNIILFLPYVLFVRFAAMLKDLVTLRFDLLFARLKAIFWILFNMALVINKRNKIQKFRKADDSYILKIFTEKYLFKPKFTV
ncbi:hypothetical protein CMO83_05525 [Candidatus Woesearchaeota archaeon]|jgi:hypothetical protein|nr:hypothetical protein [Candidatus Woesearchaeota archaeon]|tara:strand:- start:15246 stop:16205 length:960 start_codon:yes stop_codon:yes gene_type:complete